MEDQTHMKATRQLDDCKRTFGGEIRKENCFLRTCSSLIQNREHQETHGRCLENKNIVKEIEFLNPSTSNLAAAWGINITRTEPQKANERLDINS